MLIVLFIAYVLSRGLRTSMTINSIVVVIKIAIIILFLLVGMFYVKPANWDPFMPFGTKGVLVGATQVFLLIWALMWSLLRRLKSKEPAKKYASWDHRNVGDLHVTLHLSFDRLDRDDLLY